jgi:acetyl esterase
MQININRPGLILSLAFCCGWLLVGADVTFAQNTNLVETPVAAGPKQFVYKSASERKLTLEVDYPPGWKPTDQRPAIVFFFGGGWKMGTPSQFKSQAEYFAKRGLVCIRPEYRLRNRDNVLPDKCVEDAISAMRWVRAHAGELGIATNRIVAAGGSAGGHLAACTYFIDAVSDPADDQSVSPKPNALLLYNPVVDMVPLQKTSDTSYVAGLDEAKLKQISPALHLDKDAPPIFIIDGTADRFNSQIRDFIGKNKALGVSIDAAFTEGQPHGFFNKPPWMEKTTAEADAFLCRIGYLVSEPKVPLPTQRGGLSDTE